MPLYYPRSHKGDTERASEFVTLSGTQHACDIYRAQIRVVGVHAQLHTLVPVACAEAVTELEGYVHVRSYFLLKWTENGRKLCRLLSDLRPSKEVSTVDEAEVACE